MSLDERDIQRIAERLIALLDARERGQPAAALVDAETLAGLLGVDRKWVYEHAKRLGGVRLGGPKGRLRFDHEQARKALSDTGDPAPCRGGRQARPRARIGPQNSFGRAALTRPRPDTGR
jgi:hypothetical protein